MANIFQESITPDKPKVLEGERVYVYVPRATLDTPGIASYDSKDFILNNGKVHLAKDIDEEIEKHNINPNAHKEVFNTKVDKRAVYSNNHWTSNVTNDGITAGVGTLFYPNGADNPIGALDGAAIAASLLKAYMKVTKGNDSFRIIVEPTEIRIEKTDPDATSSYTTILKVDKDGATLKGDGLVTATELATKVNIETVRDVNYNLISGGKFNGTVTNTFNTEGIMSIESKAEGSKNDTIKLEFDATRSKLTYDKTSDTTYNGEVATRPYVDNKSTADRLYTDTKVEAIKKSVGYVFDTFDNFTKWIAGTYVREDGLTTSDLNIGDDIFIAEEGVPDYWVKSKSEPMTITDFSPYESGDYKPTITWLEG